jgi:hypothetical protein
MPFIKPKLRKNVGQSPYAESNKNYLN